MKTSSILFSTDQLDELIERLMPASLGLRMQQLILASEELTLFMASSRSEACCPLCGQATTRVHSHYTRSLQDLPWSELRVRVCVQVHRFFCHNPTCPRKIFTEPLADLAERYARRTNRLREALLVTGSALGGEAGARQCAAHAMPICGATILSLLRRCGTATLPTPRVLGVDDWSFQARTAGTLLVDLERHRPVEVLLGSDEQVLADWLLAHPGVEVISRDRAVSYLNGATNGAPQAKQVLDRWHLLKNLGEMLQKSLAQQMDVLQQAAREAVPTESSGEPSAVAPPVLASRSQAAQQWVQEESEGSTLGPPRLAARPRKPPRRVPAPPRKQRLWQLHMYEQVCRLSTEGWSQQAIVDHLHIHPNTVRKYQRMEQFVDQRHNPHGSSVEPYRAYLQERWSQGCRMVKTLWQELCAQGFTGSYKSVCLFTRQWCVPETSASSSSPPKRAVQRPRTPWQVKWLLLRAPEELSAHDASSCQALSSLRPALAEAACLVRKFVAMMHERESDQLDGWLDQACASQLPELHRFALGLRAEYAAARAALSEPWSTGKARRTNYQAQVSQTPDVWASPHRSVASACVTCGLMSALERTPEGCDLTEARLRYGSLAPLGLEKEVPMAQQVLRRLRQ